MSQPAKVSLERLKRWLATGAWFQGVALGYGGSPAWAAPHSPEQSWKFGSPLFGINSENYKTYLINIFKIRYWYNPFGPCHPRNHENG